MVGMMPPPPGVTPDFYHTTSVQVSFMAVFGVTFALATIALMLRFYTRVFVVKSVGLDERRSTITWRACRWLWVNLDAALLISAWAVTLAFFIVSVQGMSAMISDVLICLLTRPRSSYAIRVW